MYCKNCGNEIRDDAVICVHCGTEVKKEVVSEGKPKTGMGVVFGLFLGIIGLIIGLFLYPKETIERKTFLKAWTITYCVTVGIFLIIYIIIIAVATSVLMMY